MKTMPMFVPRYSWLHIWLCGSVLVLLIFCTIIGNVFVVAAIILERNLQSVSNYLILSLAIADLMVAVLVMPISVIYEMSRIWWMGIDLCDIWVFFDVLCCTASILHLVAIAIDRYWAVTKIQLIRSRNHSRKQIIIMIASVWITSIIISIPSRFHSHRQDVVVHEDGECRINNSEVYMIVANLGAFFLPMLVMVVIYLRIYFFAKKHIRKHSNKCRVPQTTTPIHSKQCNNKVLNNQTQKLVRFSSILVRLMSFKRKSKVVEISNDSNHAHINQQSCIVSPGLDKVEVTDRILMSVLISESYGDQIFDIPYVDDRDEMMPENELCLPNSPKSSVSSRVIVTAIEMPPDDFSSRTLAASQYRFMSSDNTNEICSHLHRSQSANSGTDYQIDSEAIFCSVNSLTDNNVIFENPSDVFCENCINALESELESSEVQQHSKSDIIERFANAEEICSENALSFYQDEVIGRSVSSKEEKISLRLNANAHMCVKEPACRESFANNRNRLSNAMWHQLKIRSRIKLDQTRERKAARTLAIITGCFLICWLPFATQNMINILSKTPMNKTTELHVNYQYLFVDSFFLWLGYTNSCLNPIIYTVFSPDFRGAFRKILFGKYYHKRRRTT